MTFSKLRVYTLDVRKISFFYADKASPRYVLVLYRKREFAIGVHEHGGIARFRYSDLKEAARFAADAVVMQIQMREE
jgi:hypothetical protein